MKTISSLQFVAAVALYFAWVCTLYFAWLRIQDYRIKTVEQEIAREEKLNIYTEQSKKYYINLKSDREKYCSFKGFISFTVSFAIICYLLYYLPTMYYVIKHLIKSII